MENFKKNMVSFKIELTRDLKAGNFEQLIGDSAAFFFLDKT